jgi:ABC-type glycerol-3-phosphate transport system substrate-binding protein
MNRPAKLLTAWAAAATLFAGTAACGGPDDDAANGGAVEISVSNMPQTTEPRDRENFLKEVAAFERANPDIKIKPSDAKWEANTFAARLSSGQLETVFMVPLTDPQAMIKRRQIADITEEFRKLPHSAEFDRRLLAPATGADGRIYGVPTKTYAMGLIYNRDLFAKAGLDPANPPKTWDEVRVAAKRISDATGVPGFGMHTTKNTGGWMLTTQTYSYGGVMQREQDGKHVAAFNDEPTRRMLELLKAMRWQDKSMGSQHLRNQDDLVKDFAAGKVAMMMGAPDSYKGYVTRFAGDPAEYGQAPVPTGTTPAAMLGGEIAVVSPKASKAQQAAALKWIDYYYLRPKYEPAVATERAKAKAADNVPVGIPDVPFYAANTSGPVVAAERANASVPLDNFAPYVAGVAGQAFVVEPPVAAQELYAALDTVVQAVLTRQDADPAAELKKAEDKVAPILERAQR